MEELHINNQVLPLYTDRGIQSQIIISGAWLELYGFLVGAQIEMEIGQREIILRYKD